MNITFDKKEFADAVGITARFSERRTATLPVLSAIIIVAGDDGIKLRATNLETGIDLALRGTIRSPGVVALPAHILKDIALSFSGTGALSFEHIGDTVTFSSGTAKGVAKTVPYEDFPTIPLPESSSVRLTLPGALLRDAIGAVVSCASSSSVRPELASVLLLASGGKIKAVATDSFRLAEKQISLEKGIPAFTALIPAKNASEIAATIPENEVTVSFDAPDRGPVSRLCPDHPEVVHGGSNGTPERFRSGAPACRGIFGCLSESAAFLRNQRETHHHFFAEYRYWRISGERPSFRIRRPS